MRTAFTLLAALGLILVAACTKPEVRKELGPPLAPPSLEALKPADYPGLHNVVAYADGLYTGAVPEGAEGFESLARMGIKTVISVDGARPDVELARRYGLRYVHLPHGYDGIDEYRRLQLARAVHDLPHPIYFHCHHGKHRSAAALGSTCVTLGLLGKEQANARMHVSGIAAQYKGLFAAVNDAKAVDPAALQGVDGSFPEIAEVADIVEAMVAIDEANDHLALIEKAGWATPKDHPDLVPAAEAGRMADHFRNGGAKLTAAEQKELVAWMQKSYEQVAGLETALVDGKETKEQLSARYKAIAQNCKDCHAKWRN